MKRAAHRGPRRPFGAPGRLLGEQPDAARRRAPRRSRPRTSRSSSTTGSRPPTCSIIVGALESNYQRVRRRPASRRHAVGSQPPSGRVSSRFTQRCNKISARSLLAQRAMSWASTSSESCSTAASADEAVQRVRAQRVAPAQPHDREQCRAGSGRRSPLVRGAYLPRPERRCRSMDRRAVSDARRAEHELQRRCSEDLRGRHTCWSSTS